MSMQNKMAHLFKWPSMFEYQIRFLQTIALPVNAKGVIKYGSQWVNSSFKQENSIKEINQSKNLQAILWLFCGKPRNDPSQSRFTFAIPIRLLIINQVIEDKSNGDLYIEFTAKEFFNNFHRVENETELHSIIYFGKDTEKRPMPGIGEGYLHLGNRYPDLPTEKNPDLNSLMKIIRDIPTYEDTFIQNREFPLIWINDIIGSKLNNSGEYEISLNKRYEIQFSCQQDESHFNRDITIHPIYSEQITERKFFGRTKFDKLPFFEKDVENKEITIEVKFSTSTGGVVSIPLILFEKVSIKWRYWAFIFYLLLWMALAAFVIFGFNSTNTQHSQIFAALIIFLSGVQTVLTTKVFS